MLGEGTGQGGRKREAVQRLVDSQKLKAEAEERRREKEEQ
jgi:hypothetical protein